MSNIEIMLEKMKKERLVSSMLKWEYLDKVDPEIADIIRKEDGRQQGNIELIASENFTSLAVMEAQGSILTNKYAEGYPGKKYYGGCEFIDMVENLAIDRAKKVFGADHANVQPHSGAQANMAVYFALLQPGDTVMGMSLDHGGHLTHGSPVNISGKYFNFVPYGVDPETEVLNYEKVREIAIECKPKMIVAGGSAYPRTLDFAALRSIADEVGAYFMVDMAHIAGLVAAGLHPNPMEYADIVTTTTHKTLRGPRGGLILCREAYAKAIDKAVFPGNQGGPLMHVIAAKAVALKEAMDPEFIEYQKQVIANAKAMAQGLQEKGFRIVSGGTDTHKMLVDLRSKGITGKEAEKALDEVRITCNKNTIPFDPQSPFITSGIRLGTPAITTRGMKEDAVAKIVEAIDLTLSNMNDEAKWEQARNIVQELTEKYPLY